MAREASRKSLVAAVLAVGLLVARDGIADPRSTTVNMKPVFRPDDQTLVCTAFNTDLQPGMRIVAQIIDDTGTNVTDFIRNNWAGEPGGVLASVTAESRAGTCSVLPRHPCYCKVTVYNGKRPDVVCSFDAIEGPES